MNRKDSDIYILKWMLIISLICLACIILYSANWEKIRDWKGWREGAEYVQGLLKEEQEYIVSSVSYTSMTHKLPVLTKKAPEQQTLIQVPGITQEQAGYKTGCELVSGAMLMQYYGQEVTPAMLYDVIDKGVAGKDSPTEAFIGNPKLASGYGCYAPPLVEAMNRLSDGYYGVDLTGITLEQIEEYYIAQGIPVVIWVTINMTEPGTGDTWTVRDGSDFTWITMEHCVVLVGMDEQVYYVLDPNGTGDVLGYEKTQVMLRYEQLGRQAVILSR